MIVPKKSGVPDKTGLVGLGRFLADRGVEVLSTGGPAKALADAGVKVKEVGAHTGFPEIMDGRVKTLHPLIHGGILGRRGDAGHMAAMDKHGIAPIDMVVVNLYPFRETIAKHGVTLDQSIGQMDLAGATVRV